MHTAVGIAATNLAKPDKIPSSKTKDTPSPESTTVSNAPSKIEAVCTRAKADKESVAVSTKASSAKPESIAVDHKEKSVANLTESSSAKSKDLKLSAKYTEVTVLSTNTNTSSESVNPIEKLAATIQQTNSMMLEMQTNRVKVKWHLWKLMKQRECMSK